MYMYFMYVYTGIFTISYVHWCCHGCLVIFSLINHNYYHHHAESAVYFPVVGGGGVTPYILYGTDVPLE